MPENREEFKDDAILALLGESSLEFWGVLSSRGGML